MRSSRLRDMFRVATMGMSDQEVMERTGLGFSRWRKMLTGEASEQGILMFCSGLGLPAEPYFTARAEVTNRSVDEIGLMMTALSVTSLSAIDKREMMEEFMRRQQASAEKQNAA